MKKYLSIILVVLLLTPAFAVPASAYSYLGYVPVNYEYWFEVNSSGTTVFYHNIYNTTDKAIVDYELTVFPRDAYGNTIYKYKNPNNSYTVTFSAGDSVSYIDAYDAVYCEGSMYGFSGVNSNTSLCRIDWVEFEDGSVWTNSQSYYYEESNFVILNDTDKMTDSYIVDPDTHKIDLFDVGYGTWKRDWYIWNDNAGWVWFSNEIEASCTVWTPSASIKLVANNNPNLYKIINFTVKEAPYFQIRCASSGKLTKSNDYDSTFYVGYNSAPYGFSLWDMVDTPSRAWYIWDKTKEEWVWFSGERGPFCQVWNRGDNAIALVHNGDMENAAVYEFYIGY